MKKIFGWFLLIIGVLAIVWGLWSSYEIFTAKKPPYEIFKVPEVEEVSLEEKKSPTGKMEQQIQEQMQQTISQQFEKMLPEGSMVKLLNLASWSIFMAILIMGGGKIASLGIQLLKSTKKVKK